MRAATSKEIDLSSTSTRVEHCAAVARGAAKETAPLKPLKAILLGVAEVDPRSNGRANLIRSEDLTIPFRGIEMGEGRVPTGEEGESGRPGLMLP